MSIIIPAGAGGFGFTLQEMIDQVADELRNITISTKITRWLNMSVTDISSAYTFGPLHKYASKGTVPSIPDIQLELDIHWLKTVEIPIQNRKIYPIDESRLSESDPNYRTLTGQVNRYYLNGVLMGLWHVPSSIFPITYSYQRRPVKLIDLTDISDLPPEWHSLIIQKAITKGYSRDGNNDGVLRSKGEEKELLKKLGANAYRRLDETVVQGTSGTSSKPGRPRVPRNIPVP